MFSCNIHSVKLTFSHLKMDAWNTNTSFLLGPSLFSGANCYFLRKVFIHERQALQRENRSVDDLFEALAGASCIACFAGEYELYPDCPMYS